LALCLILFCFVHSAFAQVQDLQLERASLFVGQNAIEADADSDRMLCLTSKFKMASTFGHFLKGNSAHNIDRVALLELAKLDFPEEGLPEDHLNVLDADEAKQVEAIDAARVIRHPNAKPISVRRLALQLKKVIQEEQTNFPPSARPVPNWSSEFIREGARECPVSIRMPKLLLALGYGVSNQYFPTNTEDQLAKELLQAPLRSLTPDEVFRKSYRINRGDLYLSLLTIENVISRHWDEPTREQRKISLRLGWITNCVRGCTNFGAWYHLFGEMLYGFSYGSLPAYLVGIVENVGAGLVSHSFYAGQEFWMNRIGARVGGRLRRTLKHWEKHHNDSHNDSHTDESMPVLPLPDLSTEGNAS